MLVVVVVLLLLLLSVSVIIDIGSFMYISLSFRIFHVFRIVIDPMNATANMFAPNVVSVSLPRKSDIADDIRYITEFIHGLKNSAASPISVIPAYVAPPMYPMMNGENMDIAMLNIVNMSAYRNICLNSGLFLCSVIIFLNPYMNIIVDIAIHIIDHSSGRIVSVRNKYFYILFFLLLGYGLIYCIYRCLFFFGVGFGGVGVIYFLWI